MTHMSGLPIRSRDEAEGPPSRAFDSCTIREPDNLSTFVSFTIDEKFYLQMAL